MSQLSVQMPGQHKLSRKVTNFYLNYKMFL